MSELYFQSQIIEDAKAFNKYTFGLKMNNRFVSGIPDLMIKVPKYDALFIEAKSVRLNSKRIINIHTTSLQRSTLRLMERAGFWVEVWVLVGTGDRLVLVRSTWDTTELAFDDCEIIERPRGQRWPIEYLLSNPIAPSRLDV
jgi:hypothetical protein